MVRFSCMAAIAVLFFATVAPAYAAKTETVNYKSGNDTISGYLATPGTPGRHPALVVIHEFFGLSDWVKEQDQKLADEGYIALAVDLYRGTLTTDPKVAAGLSRDLPRDRAVQDMKAAVDYLISRPDVDKSKIGAIGWCMGGGYALMLAVNESRLAADVVFYGAMPTEPESIRAIRAPVLGNFGGTDQVIKPEAVHQFESAMKQAGKSSDIKIYDGAGHGFGNPSNPNYNAEAAQDAWNRTVKFFAKTLK